MNLKSISNNILFSVSACLISVSSASAISIEFTVASDNNTPESAVANALVNSPNGGVCGALQSTGQTGEQGLTSDQLQMLNFCNALSSVTEVDTFLSYKSLSARSFSSLTSFVANGFNSLEMGDIAKRLSSLRKSSSKLTQKSSAFIDSEYFYNHLAVTDERGNMTGGGASADAYESGGLYDNRLSGFITGTFNTAKQDETSTLAGYKSNTNYLFAGLDYRFTDKLYTGVAIKTLSGDVALIDNGGSVDISDNSFSVYGSYYPNKNSYIQSTFTAGKGSYDITRRIDFTLNDIPFSEIANSNTDGDSLAFTLSGGYDHVFSDTGISSVADFTLAYAQTDIDEFTESDAQGFSLIVGEQSIESLSSKASLQVTKAVSTTFGVLIPELSMSWKHEFKVDGTDINAAFVVDPATTFRYTTDERESDYFIVSVANAFILPHGISGFIQYEQVLGIDNYNVSTVNIGARLEF